MEAEEYERRKKREAMARADGRHFVTGESPVEYGAAWERQVASLPAYSAYRTNLQDPATGLFFFMLGLDGLGDAPLGGDDDNTSGADTEE